MESYLGTWRRCPEDDEAAIKKAAEEGEKKDSDKRIVTLSQEGDTFIRTIDNGPGNAPHKEEFKLGVPFTSKDPRGHDCKVCATFEDGKMIDTRSCPGVYEIHSSYAVDGNKMTLVRDVNGVKTSQIWEKC